MSSARQTKNSNIKQIQTSAVFTEFVASKGALLLTRKKGVKEAIIFHVSLYFLGWGVFWLYLSSFSAVQA